MIQETRHLKLLSRFIAGDVAQKPKVLNPILAIHEAYPTGAFHMQENEQCVSRGRRIKSPQSPAK
jgi:hypothetical protein